MRSDGVPRNGSSLKASEIRYRRLFETAKDGILILDGESGIVVDANPYLENLLGYAHDELVGRALWELGPDVHVAASREAFQRLQVTEYARYENLPLETKGKEFLEVEFISNVYLVDEKRVIQCNIRDITERRRVALDLQAANEEMAALVVTLQERDVEMQQLHRLSSLLQACNTQGEACRVIALMAGELFAKQGGCLAVVKPGGSELEVVAQWGRPQFVAPAFPAHECWAIRRGQPHEVEIAGGGLPCRHYIEQDQSEHLCIPLMVQGESLGLLSFVSEGVTSESARHGRRNLALALGEAVKLSLYNLRLQARLREQANRDPLTGLFNRRYLEDSLARELHRAHRLREPIGLAMLDLDFFKQFNDAFGHEAGDHLLLQVGQVLGSALRQSDIACRYGGEEFVLVFPNTSLPDTTRRVEEIRALVRGLALRHDDRLLGAITLSAGVAASPDHGTTARELLAAADEAMYAAKRGGRDRLVSCSRTHGAADTAIIEQEPGMSGRNPVIGTPGLVRWRTPHSQGETT